MAGNHDFYIPVDYKVYEGETLIGRQAQFCGGSKSGVIEFVIESFGGTAVVESTDYCEYNEDTEHHVCEIRADAGRFVIRSLDRPGPESGDVIGTIDVIQEGSLFRYRLKGLNCRKRKTAEVIIASVDEDGAVRFYLKKRKRTDKLIAVIEDSEDLDDSRIHEGGTQMHLKYMIYTELDYAGHAGIFAALYHIKAFYDIL